MRPICGNLTGSNLAQLVYDNVHVIHQLHDFRSLETTTETWLGSKTEPKTKSILRSSSDSSDNHAFELNVHLNNHLSDVL